MLLIGLYVASTNTLRYAKTLQTMGRGLADWTDQVNARHLYEYLCDVVSQWRAGKVRRGLETFSGAWISVGGFDIEADGLLQVLLLACPPEAK